MLMKLMFLTYAAVKIMFQLDQYIKSNTENTYSSELFIVIEYMRSIHVILSFNYKLAIKKQ